MLRSTKQILWIIVSWRQKTERHTHTAEHTKNEIELNSISADICVWFVFDNWTLDIRKILHNILGFYGYEICVLLFLLLLFLFSFSSVRLFDARAHTPNKKIRGPEREREDEKIKCF